MMPAGTSLKFRALPEFRGVQLLVHVPVPIQQPVGRGWLIVLEYPVLVQVPLLLQLLQHIM